jgi:hypothetical protein
MRYLQYALWAVIAFMGAVFLLIAAAVTAPVVYIIMLVAGVIFGISIIMMVFSQIRSIVKREPGNHRNAQAVKEPTFRRDADTTSASGQKIYDDIKEDVSNAAAFIQRQLSRVWSDVEEDLARLSIVIQQRSKKTKRFWMKERIEEMIELHQGTFDLLSQKMNDDTLNELRIEYTDHCSRVNELEKEIGDLKASIAMKGEEAGGPFHRLLEKTEGLLNRAQLERLQAIELSRKRLQAYGVDLDPKQAEVLLSRVDAGDIMRMSTVFSIISNMTKQFARAKLQSGENLDVTKKYYGMYIALLELQVLIQSEYLARLDKQYIPGIEAISANALELYNETKDKVKQSSDEHKVFFEKNLQSQNFTLEVTKIYKNALVEDAQKVKKAMELLRKHHDVAVNTLKTVQVSADLSALMTQSESLYHDVMELQMPDLVPFENLQMQREFEAVTIRLREGR